MNGEVAMHIGKAYQRFGWATRFGLELLICGCARQKLDADHLERRAAKGLIGHGVCCDKGLHVSSSKVGARRIRRLDGNSRDARGILVD
jgi:hypothetical protein